MAKKVYIVREEVAEQVGVPAALVFERIRFMVEQNQIEGRNPLDGRFWVTNSFADWNEYFSFLSIKQIRTCLDRLRDAGFLVVLQPNVRNGDRTFWYSLPDEAQDMGGHVPKRADGACAQKGTSGSAQKGTSGSAQKGTSYKDKIQEIHKIHSPHTPQGDLLGDLPEIVEPDFNEEFDTVWKHYPRKVGTGTARKAWLKARKKNSFDDITKPLGIFIRSIKDTPKDKIPHLSTWLNGERWNDDQTHAINRAMNSDEQLNALMDGPKTTDEQLDALFPEYETKQIEASK